MAENDNSGGQADRQPVDPSEGRIDFHRSTLPARRSDLATRLNVLANVQAAVEGSRDLLSRVETETEEGVADGYMELIENETAAAKLIIERDERPRFAGLVSAYQREEAAATAALTSERQRNDTLKRELGMLDERLLHSSNYLENKPYGFILIEGQKGQQNSIKIRDEGGVLLTAKFEEASPGVYVIGERQREAEAQEAERREQESLRVKVRGRVNAGLKMLGLTRGASSGPTVQVDERDIDAALDSLVSEMYPRIIASYSRNPTGVTDELAAMDVFAREAQDKWTEALDETIFPYIRNVLGMIASEYKPALVGSAQARLTAENERERYRVENRDLEQRKDYLETRSEGTEPIGKIVAERRAIEYDGGDQEVIMLTIYDREGRPMDQRWSELGGDIAYMDSVEFEKYYFELQDVELPEVQYDTEVQAAVIQPDASEEIHAAVTGASAPGDQMGAYREEPASEAPASTGPRTALEQMAATARETAGTSSGPAEVVEPAQEVIVQAPETAPGDQNGLEHELAGYIAGEPPIEASVAEQAHVPVNGEGPQEAGVAQEGASVIERKAPEGVSYRPKSFGYTATHRERPRRRGLMSLLPSLGGSSEGTESDLKSLAARIGIDCDAKALEQRGLTPEKLSELVYRVEQGAFRPDEKEPYLRGTFTQELAHLAVQLSSPGDETIFLLENFTPKRALDPNQPFNIFKGKKRVGQIPTIGPQDYVDAARCGSYIGAEMVATSIAARKLGMSEFTGADGLRSIALFANNGSGREEDATFIELNRRVSSFTQALEAISSSSEYHPAVREAAKEAYGVMLPP